MSVCVCVCLFCSGRRSLGGTRVRESSHRHSYSGTRDNISLPGQSGTLTVPHENGTEIKRGLRGGEDGEKERVGERDGGRDRGQERGRGGR